MARVCGLTYCSRLSVPQATMGHGQTQVSRTLTCWGLCSPGAEGAELSAPSHAPGLGQGVCGGEAGAGQGRAGEQGLPVSARASGHVSMCVCDREC